MSARKVQAFSRLVLDLGAKSIALDVMSEPEIEKQDRAGRDPEKNPARRGNDRSPSAVESSRKRDQERKPVHN